ncbi:MAG: glycosyltransferase family 2 protein, partial [Planctomycetes bacterium]|nr:glycosyltransferase family 2 protein [Planctomycetota bacterium]
MISILIPTRNRASYLGACIASALAQTERRIEVLVSDNCSSDDTASVVEGFSDARLAYHRHGTDLGMTGNWNFCLSQAKGDLILLLSDDDLLEPDAVRLLARAMEDPEVAFSYGSVVFIDGEGRELGRSGKSPGREGGSS